LIFLSYLSGSWSLRRRDPKGKSRWVLIVFSVVEKYQKIHYAIISYDHNLFG
jgi:hypothetical protein